jgi:hypothetical protein
LISAGRRRDEYHAADEHKAGQYPQDDSAKFAGPLILRLSFFKPDLHVSDPP